MTCERYADTEMAERYVAGDMTRDEEGEFEQHFLACDACLEHVRAVEDIRDALDAHRAARQIARQATEAVAQAAHAAAAAEPDVWGAEAGAAIGSEAGVAAGAGAGTDTETEGEVPIDRADAGARRPRVLPMSPRHRDPQAQPHPRSQPQPHTRPHPHAEAAEQEAEPSPLPLRAPYRVPRWVWAAAAALIVGALWLRAVAPAPDHPVIARNPPATVPSPEPRQAPPPPPPIAAAPSLAEILAPLAIVTPPPYVNVPVRGDATPANPAVRAFETAMAHYRARDFRAAAQGLRAVTAETADAIPAQFYLGIAELMQERPEAAEAALRRVAASGETPYADEAHFYLAKAALQRRQLDTAERELEEAIRLDAGPNDDARTLLGRVRSLRAALRP